jgi:Holliday junction resolvasome RuvABC ATP-dependent DNA helicase subunit
MYGVLIVSQSVGDTVVRQTVIANCNGTIHKWWRFTNGKQGKQNAWVTGAFDVSATGETLIGKVISTPLTINDIDEIENAPLPRVLIQKLIRQHSLQEQNAIDEDIEALVQYIEKIAEVDPSALKTYYIDNRGRKSVSTQVLNSVIEVAYQPPAPVTSNVVPVVSTHQGEKRISFVPTAEHVDGYIERNIATVNEHQWYDFALKNKMNVLLFGEAGTGKTSSVMNYAKQRGLSFYSLAGNIALEPSQIFGSDRPQPDGTFKWVDGGLTEVVRNGGVLLLNELSFAPARIMTVLFSLLDYRRSITLMDNGNEVIHAHPDLLIVADMNPSYRGTQLLNEALKDRFEIKVSYEYDSAIEKKILKSSTLIDLARDMRKTSRGAESSSSSDSGIVFETPISTRLLKTFEKIANGLSYDFAVYNFINNFEPEERGAVKILLESLEHNLKTELGLQVEAINTDTLE